MPVPRVLAVSELLVVALIVVLLVFALAIVFAAIWYHFRQPKEVRLDSDEEAAGDSDEDTGRGV